jgi:hypothetical protein
MVALEGGLLVGAVARDLTSDESIPVVGSLKVTFGSTNTSFCSGGEVPSFCCAAGRCIGSLPDGKSLL